METVLQLLAVLVLMVVSASATVWALHAVLHGLI